jgi:hypothetical protein
VALVGLASHTSNKPTLEPQARAAVVFWWKSDSELAET